MSRIVPLLLLLLLFLPVVSLALELTYPKFGDIDLNLPENQSINKLVAWLYYGIITIGGLVAFFMIVSGGFQYLTSAGNPSAMGEAKDKIMNALLGLLLIFASYIILQVINPELLLLKLPSF